MLLVFIKSPVAMDSLPRQYQVKWYGQALTPDTLPGQPHLETGTDSPASVSSAGLPYFHQVWSPGSEHFQPVSGQGGYVCGGVCIIHASTVQHLTL